MHRIAYPIGGFGNHIRWLCLLSPEYNNFETINSVGFFINGKMFSFDTQKKLKFLEDYVYPEKRNCFNYIEIELNFKNKINGYFQTTHYTDDFTEAYSPHKSILVTSSVNSCIKHYFKFHPLWNGNPWKKSGRDYFAQKNLQINENNIKYTCKENEESLHIISDDLNSEVLNYELYDKICKFLEITNVYEYANTCHKLWFDLQKRSEKLLTEFFINASYPDFPWTTYKDKYAQSNIYNETDWLEMKHTALELYR